MLFLWVMLIKKRCFNGTQYSDIYEEVKKLVNSDKNIDLFKECMYNNLIAHIISIVDATCEILSDEEVRNCIRSLNIRRIESELSRIKKEIAEQEKRGSSDTIEMLFNEYSFLNKLLLQQRKPEV